MIEMPRHVQIGPYRFEVVSDAQGIQRVRAEEGSRNAVGYCHLWTSRLTIAPDQDRDMQAVTLMHETLHALGHLNRCWNRRMSEEEFVERLAPVLVDTLRRNPELVAYLTEQVPM